MDSGESRQSPLLTAVGVLVALIAIVGTQFLGWGWGSGQTVPTVIGVAVASIAVAVAARRALS